MYAEGPLPHHCVSVDSGTDDNSCGRGENRIYWVTKLQSTINGFFDGVLHTTMPIPGLSLAPIETWPELMPKERCSVTVSDDPCATSMWFCNGASA